MFSRIGLLFLALLLLLIVPSSARAQTNYSLQIVEIPRSRHSQEVEIGLAGDALVLTALLDQESYGGVDQEVADDETGLGTLIFPRECQIFQISGDEPIWFTRSARGSALVGVAAITHDYMNGTTTLSHDNPLYVADVTSTPINLDIADEIGTLVIAVIENNQSSRFREGLYVTVDDGRGPLDDEEIAIGNTLRRCFIEPIDADATISLRHPNRTGNARLLLAFFES